MKHPKCKLCGQVHALSAPHQWSIGPESQAAIDRVLGQTLYLKVECPDCAVKDAELASLKRTLAAKEEALRVMESNGRDEIRLENGTRVPKSIERRGGVREGAGRKASELSKAERQRAYRQRLHG